MPADLQADVRDILVNPPAENSYEILRQRILARSKVSKHTRYKQLLEQEHLGDSSPSQFLRRLQVLAEGTVEKGVVRHMFFERMPDRYKVGLAALSESTPIEEVAAVADHMAELLPNDSPTVSHVQDTENSEIEAIKENQRRIMARLDQLAEDVAKLSVEKKANRGRSNSPKTQSKGRVTEKICWKHKRFGDKANACIPPCAYKGQGKE